MSAHLAHEPEDFTAFLHRLRRGEAVDDERLLRLLHDALRAEARRTPPRGAMLISDATELVHEVYLRLFRGATSGCPWRDREHFFRVACKAMRHVLASAAKRELAQKRGGGRVQSLAQDVVAGLGSAEQIAALDEAFDRLREHDAFQAKIVELRLFAGMSPQDIEDQFGVDVGTGQIAFTRGRHFLRQLLE
ncbi:MAG: ECF-type sigma factor [Planctomycetota bacterium]